MPLRAQLLAALLVLASPSLLAAPRSQPAQEHATSKPQPVPGTRVTLTPPPGFRVPKAFSGFVLEENRASIQVTDMLGPFAEMQSNLTSQQFASRGMKLLSEEPVDVGGVQGVLLRVEQVFPKGTLLRWMLLLGDASESTLITAAFPAQDSERLSTPLREALLAARWNKQAPPAPMDPGFVLKTTPGLRLARQFQNFLVYTPDGTYPDGKSDLPVLIAKVYPGDKSASDVRDFAERRMREKEQADNITLESSKPVSLGGVKGHEAIARATNPLTGAAIVIYQLVLAPRGENSYLVEGRVAQDQRAKYLPRFQAAARSLTWK